MLQRRQTLYLIGAIALLALLYALPLVRYAGAGADERWVFTIFGLRTGAGAEVPEAQLQVPLAALVGVVILLLAVTVVLYKQRTRQLRLSGMAFLFTLALVVALVVTHGSISAYLEQGRQLTTTFAPGLFIPLPVLLLCWLAGRGIRADEALVRSANRLR